MERGREGWGSSCMERRRVKYETRANTVELSQLTAWLASQDSHPGKISHI